MTFQSPTAAATADPQRPAGMVSFCIALGRQALARQDPTLHKQQPPGMLRIRHLAVSPGVPSCPSPFRRLPRHTFNTVEAEPATGGPCGRGRPRANRTSRGCGTLHRTARNGVRRSLAGPRTLRGQLQVLPNGAQPSGTPAPACCLHTRGRRTRPARTSCAPARRESNRGVRSFFASAFAAASGAGLVSCGFGSTPAWGTRNGRGFAPGAKTPWNLVRFARGGGTRDATRRKSSSPVKSRCVVPSGSGRFIR
jgi:hypothetical protein